MSNISYKGTLIEDQKGLGVFMDILFRSVGTIIMVKKVLPPLDEQNQSSKYCDHLVNGRLKMHAFLEKLAKGLKMGGEEVVSAADINSVPDVWARVLNSKKWPLLDNRASIVNEWRGTLSLLALAPYYTAYIRIFHQT